MAPSLNARELLDRLCLQRLPTMPVKDPVSWNGAASGSVSVDVYEKNLPRDLAGCLEAALGELKDPVGAAIVV